MVVQTTRWTTLAIRLAIAGTLLVMAARAAATTSQEPSATLAGTVLDDTSGVVPGVALTAMNMVTGTRREARSERDGSFVMPLLQPGAYVVTAECPGFAAVEVRDVVLRPNDYLVLKVRLRVAPVRQSVTVHAGRDALESAGVAFVVGPLPATQGIRVSGELQRQLPLAPTRDFASFLFLTPGALSEEDGSHFVHGATYDSQSLRVDGADLTSNLQAVTWLVQFSAEAIDEVEVKTAAIDPASPLTLGPVISVTTRSGENALHGAVGGLFQAKRWTGDNEPGAGTSELVRLIQPESSLGGPVHPSRWWFFASHRWTNRRTDPTNTAEDVAMLRALVPGWAPLDTIAGGHYYFLKTTAALGRDQQMSGFYQRDRNPSTFGAARRSARLSESFQGGSAFGASLSSIWGDNVSSRLLASYNDKTFGADSRLRGLTARRIHAGTFHSGGALAGTGVVAYLDSQSSCCYAEPYDKLTLAGDLTVHRHGASGWHQIQTGFYLQPRLHAEFRSFYNNGGFNAEDAVLRDPADPAAGWIPFHREVYDAADVTTMKIHGRDYAFYLQDNWRPTSRLTIGLGARIDLFRERDVLFDQVVRDSAAVGPRFSAAYSIGSRDEIRGSWGRVHESMNFGRYSAGSSTAGVHNLYDTDLDGVFETDFYTPGSSKVAQDRTVDVHRSQPYINELTLGYRRSLPARFVVEGEFVRREFRAAPTSYETNAIYRDGVFQGYRNEAFNAVSWVTANRWSWPVVTDLTVQATRQANALQLVASYTHNWRHAAGSWVPSDPAAIIQPDAFPNNRGIADTRATPSNSLSGIADTNTRQWIDDAFRIGASVVGPWGLMAAGQYQVQSGNWSGPVVTRLVEPDAVFGPDTVKLSNGRVVSNPLATVVRFAYPTRGEGQMQLPPVHLLNIRLGHRLALAHGRLETAIDVFNVPNLGRFRWFEIGGNQIYSSYFGKGRMRQRPRSAQVSVRFVF
jgi:hypothetical protein